MHGILRRRESSRLAAGMQRAPFFRRASMLARPHDMIARWEHFEHEADMGLRGFGATAAEAFEQTALALSAVVTELDRIRAEEPVPIHCEAQDLELLLAEWLNALIYEMATRRMLFSRFEVRLADGVLEASAWGERVEPGRHQPAVEVKGATYTALRVVPHEDGWMAQTVVDV